MALSLQGWLNGLSSSTLENACWVCDEPFDDSKPSKPFKKEAQEELEIEDIKDYKK